MDSIEKLWLLLLVISLVVLAQLVGDYLGNIERD